jgi:predicted nucleotidyltransferase component of viral defense system
MKDNPFFKQAELILQVLPFVAQEKNLALKGGTAINLFVRDLPRLSVDIDLTYLPIESRSVSLTHISSALERIADSIKPAIPGVKVFESKLEQKYVIKLFINFKGVQIKIEPNLVIRGTVFPCVKRDLVANAEALFERFTSVRTLSIADLYGGKICAALDRQHPRDLFDIKILMEHEGILDDIRRAFVIYLAGHPRPISEVLNPKLQNIRRAYEAEFVGLTRLQGSLDELVATRQKLIDFLRGELTEEERQFLLSIKEGEPQWKLMGIDGIEKLPAIQWKLINIRKMAKKKRVEALDKLRVVLDL